MEFATSQMLIVSPTEPQFSRSFGADWAESFEAARVRIHHHPVRAVVFPIHFQEAEALAFAEWLQLHHPEARQIVIGESDKIIAYLSKAKAFCLLKDFSPDPLATALQKAMAAAAKDQQAADLVRVVNEQKRHFDALKVELEERVQDRQKYLDKVKKRLERVSERAEVLNATLVAIHQATTVEQTELVLNQILKNKLGLKSVRLTPSHDDGAGFTAPLEVEGQHLGGLTFIRDEHSKFRKEESDFFLKISEAVALAIARFRGLEQAEVLKRDWEITFNSISDPLCLVDREFHVLRANRAFEQHPYLKDAFLKSRDKEIIALNQQIFEVNTHKLAGAMSLILFRDVTSRQHMEKQILESAKMAELGVIGSSIAHELNNPLGGIISFLQLIKIDLKPNDPALSDLDEMENAALRCKEIIENLLGFARKSNTDGPEPCELSEIISTSINIVELQTRAKGLRFAFHKPKHSCRVNGNRGLLAQALCHLLQNSVDAINEVIAKKPMFPGQVSVRILDEPNHFQIEVSDNGPGIPTQDLKKIFNPLFTTKDPKANSGLGLTMAFRTAQEHGGNLEITSEQGRGTTARLRLPRLDLQLDRQVFDGKI